ncbi:MAG: bifunctional UDP-N-acetylglucosamine diphosphorylase/glucosamine-1-phosphate N-acetyltransferase GlmU [Holosporaceae bacterium]|jgi:bifunctional UDP-N-acetylglucosamine pyrophosphorylase/glucosamine-1-phosphate N-acetyltransferase|nr:bifunctional UDP-N-acetylglucosamine diphosphorylase/glucosamine-1-phosphate N-acetyltransferase GlmU [Holosporaceae bacterium]
MDKAVDSIIILAAGLGSRMMSNIPKVFHKIGGLFLVDHVIKAAKSIGPDEISVVINPKYKDVALEFESYVIKPYQDSPKGTADAVKVGLNSLRPNDDGWVYILYGDIPMVSPKSLKKLAEISKQCKKTSVVVLAMDSSDAPDLGKLEKARAKGTIKSIVEAKDNDSSSKMLPLCNCGLFIKKSVLKQLIDKIEPSKLTGEFYITKIVRLAYESGYVCRYYEGNKKELFGVNTNAELSVAERIFQERERLKHMNNGVTLIAPETVFFSHDTYIESDVVIYPYVVFSNGVRLKSGTQIKPFCVLEGSTVIEAQIGPFSRLRSETEICSGAKVGNFVEIKNSIVSEGTRVNHLSYIGDSDVGRDTNIGAGTITCNYDGFRKHKTVIGEKVFIGSNTALVAPIKVNDAATIGAGSVITKDVPSNSLGIARNSQSNIENWTFKRRKKCVE